MAKSAKEELYIGTGRRKTAVARVRLKPGEGRILVNQKTPEEYFSQASALEKVRAPLIVVGCDKNMDLVIRVNGGGVNSQAGAVQLGIARALLRSNEEFEETLRDRKFLTRDSRKKERKKYGRAGARRSFQFSKR